jgi:hypothetical protein
MLAGSLLFFAAAGTVMTDPALMFCVALSQLAFWHAMQGRGKRWGYLFFAGLGLGLLAKGRWPSCWLACRFSSGCCCAMAGKPCGNACHGSVAAC